MFLQQFERFLNGEPLLNLVDKATRLLKRKAIRSGQKCVFLHLTPAADLFRRDAFLPAAVRAVPHRRPLLNVVDKATRLLKERQYGAVRMRFLARLDYGDGLFTQSADIRMRKSTLFTKPRP